MQTRYGTIVAVAALALAVQQQARAELVGFERITSTASVSVGSQLQAEVTNAGGNQVDFKFTNAVGIASSICDIYFDDNASLFTTIASITDSGAGVAFSQGASPPNLPGGNNANPDFDVTAGLLADTDAPVAPNGINSASEWVTLRLNLAGGKTFADVLAALAAGGSTGLRIGLHVQAIGTAGVSDSYVNTPLIPEDPEDPGDPVPAPGAGILAMIGMGLVGRLKRAIA